MKGGNKKWKEGIKEGNFNRKTNNRKVGKEEHGKEQDRRTNQEKKEMWCKGNTERR